jgi:hypothetical protein
MYLQKCLLYRRNYLEHAAAKYIGLDAIRLGLNFGAVRATGSCAGRAAELGVCVHKKVSV